ncbi:UNVERIFIED_ORG: O-antigen ligase [Arthrobacter sp. UYEF10]
MKEINMKRRMTPHPPAAKGDSLARIALIATIASVFVILPGGLFQFALPKIALLSFAVALGLFVPSPARLHPAAAWAAAAVFVTFAVSALASDGFGPGFWGRWPRYEGVPTVAVYLLLLAAGARLFGPGAHAGRRARWAGYLSWAMMAMAALAIIEGLGARPFGENEGVRPGGFLGNATDMGLVGLMGCTVLLPAAVWKRSAREIAGTCSGALIAVASGSRAVMLVLLGIGLAVLGYRAVVQWRTHRSLKPVAILGGALAVTALLATAFPLVRDRILTSDTVTGRLELWTVTWDLLQKHLLIGVGPGRFVDALPAVQTKTFAARVGTDYPADSPHLIVLQWWADGGVMLVLANLALCTALVAVAILNLQRSAGADRLFLVGSLAAVTAFAAVLMTHVPSPGTTAIAALSAGALAAAPARSTDTTRNPDASKGRGRLIQVAGAASCTLIGGAAVLAASAELPLKSAANDIYAGNLIRASGSFDTAGSLRPWDGDVALLAGQAFAGRASAGDPAAGRLAASWAAKSLKHNPGSVESLVSLAVGQLASGEVEQARHTLAFARQLAPVNSQVWLQSGLAEHAAGDTPQAVSSVEKAVSLTPDPAEELRILDALRHELAAQETGP